MVEEICPICGLPKSICTCKIIQREAKKIKIYVTTRRFKKPMTIIKGIDEKSGKSISKQLKRKMACGGTFKNGNVELQGRHVERAKEELIKLGFEEEQIETE